MQTRRRPGLFAGLIKLLLLGAVTVYGVAGVTSPWAFHIGGRATPLLYWSGSGNLVTKDGAYPLFVFFYPYPHASRLRMDGHRPTGGLKGTGSLCTAPGVLQPLNLSGTIYNGWSTTNHSLFEFRLITPKVVEAGQKLGYFNLYGRWHGPLLMMGDRGEHASSSRSGLKLDHASVTLEWSRYSDFKRACANGSASP